MYGFLKRVADIVLSALALIVLAVPMLIIAVAVKLSSRGPILFRQERVGRNCVTFMMPKFRSMYTEAPANMPTHLLNDPSRWITPVGRFIRKTSLDELPQLWCILAGRMSLIGPRPALWNQRDLIDERDKYGANGIRPGLTGWAQINGRDELNIEVKAKLDGEYTNALNAGGFEALKMDCRCFFGTIVKVLRSDGVVEGCRNEIHKEKEDARI